MSAYPTGGSSNSAAFLSYQPAETIHGMYVGALSSSGQLTLVNDGSHAVDLTVGSEGYLVSPTGPETGSEYVDAPQARVETTTTPVPANGSITFAVEGTDNIPTSGVSAVVENVRAQNPQDTGFLSIYATGASDPGQPGVNFYASQNTGSNLTVPMVSSAGQQTVTNHSNGTVNVTVAVRGYYQAPSAPDPPSGVAATVSGSSATVSWTAPTGDGGSPITGYAVAATPDGATVTVSGTATSATLSNLANAAADTFSVTAVNQIGTSDQATFVLQQVITGTVTAPNGSPVPSDQIQFVTNDGDATSAPVTPTVLGTAVTDGNGRWSFTVPSYASLPADAHSEQRLSQYRRDRYRSRYGHR